MGLFSSQAAAKVYTRAGSSLLGAYFLSMYVYPWFKGDRSWQYVHDVWHYWQSLNVGMIAFASSIIAFNISIYNAERQREREYLAARSFLPDALSELYGYTKSCVPVLKSAWVRVGRRRQDDVPLSSVPPLPSDYKTVFGRCIEYAEPAVGDHLSYILVKLQINHARLTSMLKGFEDGDLVETKMNLVSYFYCLGELMALINKTYDYARGMADFDSSPLKWNNFSTAYLVMDIIVEEYEDLEGFTKRAIERRVEGVRI